MLLFVVQRELEDLFHAVLPDDGRDGEAKAIEAVFAMEFHGDGKHGVLVFDDDFANAGDRGGDAIIGRALALDDVVGTIADGFVDLAHAFLVVLMAADGAEVVDGDAGDVGDGPDGELGITMLADDDAMDVARIDIEVAGELVFEAGGI